MSTTEEPNSRPVAGLVERTARRLLAWWRAAGCPRNDAEMDAGVGRLMAWYTTDHARRDAERQALRRQQAGSLDKAQSSKQVTAQGAECAAKGSGPCSIGQHGPRGALQCVWCGEPPNVAGNRLAEGKSELTGLLGGPARSEKD